MNPIVETRRRHAPSEKKLSASLGAEQHLPAAEDKGEQGKSIWTTISFNLRESLGVVTLAASLFVDFWIPELRDWITHFRMGKIFDPAREIGSLDGKVVLVTGGNTGLGKQTVAYLAAHNPTCIYLAARTASKARDAIADIKAEVPNACEIVHLPLDLSSFPSIAEAAATFKAKESRLDILINNAGIMATPYSTTKEGYEIQFGTNHVGHALLTKLLLPTLLETAKELGADVRVITLSSLALRATVPGGIEFDQVAAEKHAKLRRYGASKLANLLFARELAVQYPQITSVSVHPGLIVTDIVQSLRTNWFMKLGIWLVGLLAMVLPDFYQDTKGGALNQVWAATTRKEGLVNGGFYKPKGVLNEGSKWAKDEALQTKLWKWTEAELERFGY